MVVNGRKTIFVNYTEKELLSDGNVEEQAKKVIDIIQNTLPLHETNKRESIYLYDYLYGDQDIKYKEKKTRTDINHTSVENWSWAFMDWKKAFLLGKPIRYAPVNDVSSEEISKLNAYNTYEDKDWLDEEIYEDIFTVGRGFRYTFPSEFNEEDEAPFELLNLDVFDTEVVYSSGINHEQLLTYVQTSKLYVPTNLNPLTGELADPVEYDEFTVYTRNAMFVINNLLNNWQVTEYKPIILNMHIVTEYYMNRKRIGLLELVKDIFDDINYVENLDLDDIEAFVNSIMVFTNAEVNKESMEAIKEYGAVSIKSTDQKKASVEILQSRLKSLDTQIYYLRKLSAVHNILSVPQASNNGEISNAETGKAVLTGQGFTSSSVRVETEEKAFKKCDRNALKVVLKICKEVPNSGIKTLKVSDIESKFSRDLSENLLNKTQALLNLTTANIPPEIRNQVIGLFSDPVNVTRLQEKFEKERQELQQQMFEQSNNNDNKNNTNKVNEQNNKLRKTTEKNKQEQ